MSGKKRDDSYFAASRRRHRKYMMIIIPIVVAVVAAGAAAAVLSSGRTFGPLGSAHEHAVFAVWLDGDQVDFSQSKYQVKSQYIHVENGDGTTLHRHATGVPVGEFFKTVNMEIQNNCFFHDDGRQFCEDGTKMLRYYVNYEPRSSIMDYVLEDNDKILIIYGSETEEQIQAALDLLNATSIRK